jgi:hypothetical protein
MLAEGPRASRVERFSASLWHDFDFTVVSVWAEQDRTVSQWEQGLSYPRWPDLEQQMTASLDWVF